MQIHTVKEGDTVFKIARQYSTSPMKIIENNELQNPDRLTVGEKLMIFHPTRTYTVRGSDTLEGIANRFGVKKESLLASNPYLSGGDKLYPGQLLAIKYDAPKYGAGYGNGYYYRGVPMERLMLALPYISYLTVAAARRQNGEIRMTIDDTQPVKIAKERGKIPLLRIYDDGVTFDGDYASELTRTAKDRGYGGVTVAAYRAMRENKSGFEDFLMRLRRELIDDGLLLFCEIDANSEHRIKDIADGYVLMYEKCHLEDIPSFEDGEARMLYDFAENGNVGCAFLDLSPYAYVGGEEESISDTIGMARSSGKNIEYDSDKMICHFDYNRYVGGRRETVRATYESPENIKTKLELLSELGFMGVSFDIARIPVEYLLLFETMFSHPRA